MGLDLLQANCMNSVIHERYPIMIVGLEAENVLNQV